MTQQPLLFANQTSGSSTASATAFDDRADITAKRHKGSETSIAANAKASKGKTAWRYLCLDYIKRHGTATLEEICHHFNKTPNQLSGRLSGLRAEGKIAKTGDVRNGFAVYEPK